MKIKLVITTSMLALAVAGLAFAHEGGGTHDEMMEQKGAMMDQAPTPAASDENATVPIEVGNKICPVSGDEVGEMEEIVKKEYKGKVYNFCCNMCLKDFDKDPEKYVKKVEDMMANEGK